MKLTMRVVTVVVLALLTAPLYAEGQQAVKIPRIGYLSPVAPTSTPAFENAFRQGLRELGYVEGGNITIEYRWAEGKYERLPELATELVRLKVEVILAATTPAMQAANITGLTSISAEITGNSWSSSRKLCLRFPGSPSSSIRATLATHSW
jgi:ABC-type uncharacterized transport system substrate-binding protein